MKNLLELFFISLLFKAIVISSQKSPKDAINVKARIYEVDERNSIIKLVEETPDSEVFLNELKNEKESRIRLECSTNSPVQWIYIGPGVPTLTSSIRKESSEKFIATAFITSLTEKHTGKYVCASTDDLRESHAYFYIYVPGPNVFTTGLEENERTIYIPKNDSKIRIPCSVSNPKVSVMLEKSIGDVLVPIKSTDPSKSVSYDFDPKFGFDLDVNQIKDPEGTYVCTATNKGKRKTIEFKVLSTPFSIADAPSNLNDNEDERVYECKTHTDCPPNWSCYTDLKCRDPCIHSIRCGKFATCKYRERRPYCECPFDFIGDPNSECFNTLQGTQDEEVTKATTTSSEKPACQVNEECPKTHICIRGTCVDPCAIKICDKNAYCVTDASRIPMCICSPGYKGSNGEKCEPSPYEVQPIKTNKKTEEKSTNPEQKSPETLYLSEINSCKSSRDCPLDSICKTFKNDTKCVVLCGESSVCGIGAICAKTNTSKEPRTLKKPQNLKTSENTCICPPGTSGDPYNICIETKIGKNCDFDRDCGTSLRCETKRDSRTCVDPCGALNCPYNTECRVINHLAGCYCPAGSTGSPLVGCSRDDETETFFGNEPPPPANLQLEVTTGSSLSHLSSTNCSSLSCGPNSECRLFLNNPTCFCTSSAIGTPPHCKKECSSNNDCPLERACIGSICRSVCRNKCGPNAKCRVNGVERAAVCSCRQGYEGDATIECTPIREH